jgi:hypothetical protein
MTHTGCDSQFVPAHIWDQAGKSGSITVCQRRRYLGRTSLLWNLTRVDESADLYPRYTRLNQTPDQRDFCDNREYFRLVLQSIARSDVNDGYVSLKVVHVSNDPLIAQRCKFSR